MIFKVYPRFWQFCIFEFEKQNQNISKNFCCCRRCDKKNFHQKKFIIKQFAINLYKGFSWIPVICAFFKKKLVVYIQTKTGYRFNYASKYIHSHPRYWCNNRTTALGIRSQGLGLSGALPVSQRKFMKLIENSEKIVIKVYIPY